MQRILLSTVIGLAALLPAQLHAQCAAGETEVVVAITTDQYGTETTWELTDITGNTVFADGGPYTNLSSPGTSVKPDVTVCIPDYTVVVFTIYDAYGDGMSSQTYGYGSYSVTMDGVVIAQGGAFGSSESTMFQTGVPMERDLAILELTVPAQLAIGSQTITGMVHNFGTTAITSFDIHYAVNGGATVDGSISANIAPGSEYAFSHPTPWVADYGTSDITVWLSNTNNEPDQVNSNDTLSTSTSVIASQAVDRVLMMEQFTSSTCGPCAVLNVSYAPFLQSFNTNHVGSKVAAVKYHMNWPAPGNDPSYNPDGNTRKSYYGVTGIPNIFLNGSEMTGYSTQMFNYEASKPAFIDIGLAYTVDQYTVNVTATVDCFTNAFTGGHKLHVVAVEDSYSYPASTTSQDEFHYVQRKMFPNGQGTTLSALSDGSTQTVNLSYTFLAGAPAQGNYKLWTDLDHVTLVAFVQNTSTKKVHQAAILPMEVAIGIQEDIKEHGFALYPNPTNGLVNIGLELPQSGNAQVVVTNVLGEQVFAENKAIGFGMQRTTLDLSHLNEGIYFVNITSEGFRASRTVHLAK